MYVGFPDEVESVPEVSGQGGSMHGCMYMHGSSCQWLEGASNLLHDSDQVHVHLSAVHTELE